MNPDRITRRRFFRDTGAGALSIAAGAVIAPRASAAVPNDVIRLGLIGCGGMGNRHLDNLLQNPRCKVVGVCDVFLRRANEAAQRVGPECAVYQDYRRLLDRTDIDAVFSATPDHWHALIAVDACQAGKDVYTEKPLATTIVEGRAMVDAARRYGRVMQVGIQQRSQKLFHDAVGIVRSGKLGQITAAGAWISANGDPGLEKPGEPPADLDWDLWLGPAPWVPYSPQRQFGFRAFHDYANGELTNWGVHLMDIVHWGIGQQYPLTIEAAGGSFRGLRGSDDYEHLEILYEYPGCIVTWEQHEWLRYGDDKTYGMRFQGSNGRLYMNRESFLVEPDALGFTEVFEQGDPWIDVADHHNNFFDCIASRERPNGDVQIAHEATNTVLLGAIALDTHRKLTWDARRESFVNDPAAARLLWRPYRAPWTLKG